MMPARHTCTVLGIHLGHDASCAVVRDGILIAATQAERHTGRKHDVQHSLSNNIPIKEVLRAAKITLGDIDLIVSCFQGMAPGGYGLNSSLIEPQFDLFDPLDRRHFCISHHLAHACHGFGCSHFAEAAIIVCDMAGSSTQNGLDFAFSFKDWTLELTRCKQLQPTKTETLSLYHAGSKGLQLKDRHYWVSHVRPQSFIQSATTLYENVSYAIFKKYHSHGQLMALAAYGDDKDSSLNAKDLVSVDACHNVIFKNDWQFKMAAKLDSRGQAGLARACQAAFEQAMLATVARSKALMPTDSLVGVGGAFLNITTNTKILDSGSYKTFYVPSAPNDAGISIGCAYWGTWHLRGFKPKSNHSVISRRDNDRLGISYGSQEKRSALRQFRHFIKHEEATTSRLVNELLSGKIIARFSGRAEFGPRALGARSLLGSPMLPETKARLNQIKGRQSWRPVAPIVLQSEMVKFFDGPRSSPHMNFSHTIKPLHRRLFPALAHPDNSTRVQTLLKSDDSGLYELIRQFGIQSGAPVLVNTSFNGPGTPMVESPHQAIDFFLKNPGIDFLLLENRLLTRLAPWGCPELHQANVILAQDARIVIQNGKDGISVSAGGGKKHFSINMESAKILLTCAKVRRVSAILEACSEEISKHNLYSCLVHGLLQVNS